MSDQIRFVQDGEVIDVEAAHQDKIPGGNGLTFRSERFYYNLTENSWVVISKEIINDGVNCQILSPASQSWQKGKVKLALIFIPDDELEVEQTTSSPAHAKSPLEEIRQMNVSTM
jgi:KGK domain